MKDLIEQIATIWYREPPASDETIRAALAEALGLRALPRVAATFEVTRRGADRLRVVGSVGATVGQTCVVTLEPIENEIEEAVDIEFVRAAATDIGEPVITGDRAQADFTLRLRFQYAGSQAGSSVQRYRATLARRDGNWQIVQLSPR